MNLSSSHGWDRAGQTGVRAHLGRKNSCMVMSEGVHMYLSFTGGHVLITYTDSEYTELGWSCNTVLPQADRHNSALFPRMTRSPRSKRLRPVHRWVAVCSVSLLPPATAPNTFILRHKIRDATGTSIQHMSYCTAPALRATGTQHTSAGGPPERARARGQRLAR